MVTRSALTCTTTVKATMDDFKTRMGANFEDKRKRWLEAGGISCEDGPPLAPKQCAHATVIKGETEKDMKGTKYNLFSDGAKKGKCSSHITYAVRAPIMPKVVACAKRLGQAAVRLTECVDRFITQARADWDN